MGSARTARIFISTGEVSGDLQGSLLIEALYRQAAQQNLSLEILALGGDRMAAAGAKLVGNTLGIGSVGIFEALPYILPSLRIQKLAKQTLLEQPPDLAVLIDYMNPNMVMGQFLKSQMPQVPVVYYIAPQQWVWGFSEQDTQRMVRNSDQMLAIFPEEAKYYREHGANVEWVGHPLLDRFPHPPDRAAARAQLGLDPDRPVVVLLPASRQQEVRYLMPRLFQAARRLQDYRPDIEFLIPASSEYFQPILRQAIADYSLQGRVIESGRRLAIAAADLALTKSGTANLEIALMNVPQVVVYRLNPVSAWVAHHLLKISLPFISPVNLVEMKPVVPELIQWQMTPEAVCARALDLLDNPASRQRMLAGYASMRQALGEPGVCDRSAAKILSLLPATVS
ncbi:lipid-A-disaccharide synthase [filamentous cyanobacterium CCP5]|nr:lipid-A-disaccharide synthase [filamentous cyanobacterium CCP5]